MQKCAVGQMGVNCSMAVSAAKIPFALQIQRQQFNSVFIGLLV
jgi:hypothetical protein